MHKADTLTHPGPETLLYQQEMTIRWGDMDALGHVNNSVYFTYFEQARQQWIHGLQIITPENQASVIMKAKIHYQKPIIYPQQIIVEVHILEIGRTSFRVGHKIIDANDSNICFTLAEVTLVWINTKTGRPCAIPQTLLKAINV